MSGDWSSVSDMPTSQQLHLTSQLTSSADTVVITSAENRAEFPLTPAWNNHNNPFNYAIIKQDNRPISVQRDMAHPGQ